MIAAVAAKLVWADDFGIIRREVHLKSEAETWSQNVCVYDLVQETWVQGRCTLNKQACCSLSLGGELEKNFKRIVLAKEFSKLNLGGITLDFKGSPGGAEEVHVRQTRRELKIEEVREKILSNARRAQEQEKISVSVKNIRIPQTIYIRLDEENDWDVQLPKQLTDLVQVKVVHSKDQTKFLGWVQANFALEAEVYVSKRVIKSGEPVNSEDFQLVHTDILDLQRSGTMYFQKEKFPLGVRAKFTITKGAILTATSIERVPMVQLGDVVTLILRSDNLKVSTKGVAQSSAAIGDMVTVQLPRYNRTFRGRLMDGRLVEVWL